MRRRISLAAASVILGVLVTLMSCESCGGTNPPQVDAGTDAGTDTGVLDTGAPVDAGQDGAMDAGDAADASDAGDADAEMADAGPRLSVEPILDVVSTEPCVDWTVMADTRPRGLPASSTPRQLWRWRAYDDPVYLATGLFNQYLHGGPSIGPDGNLYIIGPEQDRVMSLTRDGNARWISDAVGGELLPTMTMAPDGDAYVAESLGGGEFALLRFSPSGELVGGGRLVRRPAGASPSAERVNNIAMGPGGMVYATTPHGRLVATCRGSVRWVMTLRYVVSGTAAYGLRVMIDRDGVLWLTAAASQTFRLTADGAVLETIVDESPHNFLRLHSLGGGQALLSAATTDSSRYWANLWEEGRIVHRFDEEPHLSMYLLDPLGAVWQIQRRPPEFGVFTTSRWVDEVETWSLETGGLMSPGYPGAWGSDASRIETRRGGGIRRVLPTGVEAWGHEFDRIAGPSAGHFTINLDVDGVAYVESGGDIVAFQTDVLPPLESGCWDIGCNRRRNYWEGSP